MTRFRMTSIVVLTLALSLFFLGCSRGKVGPAAGAITSDSAATVDSSANAGLRETSVQMSYEQRLGMHLYRKYCSTCHGVDGKGDGFNAFNLDPKPRDFSDARYMDALTDSRIAETIMQGGRGVNRSLLMPSWGGRLNKDEVQYLVSFLRSFRQAK
jgi:cytochrome c oxidase cbb3-type subunit III